MGLPRTKEKLLRKEFILKQAGISESTWRKYMSMGLIGGPVRVEQVSTGNRYLYSAQTMARLNRIVELKKGGKTLREIQTLLRRLQR